MYMLYECPPKTVHRLLVHGSSGSTGTPLREAHLAQIDSTRVPADSLVGPRSSTGETTTRREAVPTTRCSDITVYLPKHRYGRIIPSLIS